MSNTLGSGIKNLGNSAIQILEGTGARVEQAIGTGTKILNGVSETVAAAESGSKGAIRIAQVSYRYKTVLSSLAKFAKNHAIDC